MRTFRSSTAAVLATLALLTTARGGDDDPLEAEAAVDATPNESGDAATDDASAPEDVAEPVTEPAAATRATAHPPGPARSKPCLG